MNINPRILVTAANGQLGRLVVARLLQMIPAERLVATVRNAQSAEELKTLGVEVRVASYDDAQSLRTAFRDVDRVLLISSSEVGRRVQQHRNAIEAARDAGVKFVAYTSLLHADSSPLSLAVEHRESEAALRASGLPFAILRNGWYIENDTANIAAALQHGLILGAAGKGRFSSAARADYAEAAAIVMSADEVASERIYELAGDTAFTRAELAAEYALISGRDIAYRDLSEENYTAALVQAGLPESFAATLADADKGASQGFLFDNKRQLSQLIGRPTAALTSVVERAFASLGAPSLAG